MRKALITGVTGQDGSYLAEFLLSKGYKVFGMHRRISSGQLHYRNIRHLLDNDQIELVEGDLLDSSSLSRIIRSIKPDEVYNLAAQSFVKISWEQPEYTSNVNALGVARLLEAIRSEKPDAKFYQASTSEMFGNSKESPQNEKTPFYPRSPYGVSKLFAHWLTINYRESHGMFTVAGILFNHESPRRGLEFVTRKITYNVAKIKLGLAYKLELGNPDAKRDWGFAGDYVRAMWQMLQNDQPIDFVIGSGQSHSVREFVQEAFNSVDLDPESYVVYNNAKDMRPAEVNILTGDASKAKLILKWKPEVGFKQLVRMMVESDLETLK